VWTARTMNEVMNRVAYKDAITERSRQEDLVIILPLEGVVCNQELLVRLGDWRSALEDNVI
jgi:hypothetical protein